MNRTLKILSFEDAKDKIAENLVREEFFKKALISGRIVVNYGTTNFYILKHMGIDVDYESFTAGIVSGNNFGVTPAEKRVKTFLFDNGVPRQIDLLAAVDLLQPGDLFIKGGNILFPDSVVGVYVLSPTGGTVSYIAELLSKGVLIISPLSISKKVDSYPSLSRRIGKQPAIYYLKNTKIYTEIDAYSREGYTAVYLGVNGYKKENSLLFELMKKEE